MLAETLERVETESFQLESVSSCPACSGTERTLMYTELADWSFGTAPGTWSLHRCSDCRSAYLDPRPTEATIGRAYDSYYTHEARTPAAVHKQGLAAFRERLGNGYRNWRYGADLRPSSRAGILAALLFPSTRRASDHFMRFLPRRPGKLLDVGCGNGEFLSRAKAVGWSVHGTEPDRKAVALARLSGGDVRHGCLDQWADAAGTFDAITLSHVVEHLHDPVKTLRQAFALLRPKGFLYIETPNIDAPTHQEFGADWRGLETPRHLVIFSHRALEDLLAAAGFKGIRPVEIPSFSEFLQDESRRIMQVRGRTRAEPRRQHFDNGLTPLQRREFLAFTCRKTG